MGKRVRLEESVAEEPQANLYFTSEQKDVEFIPSGCTMLDCILGGGYALGRMVNVVGDKSTAKTGLATEALVNFVSRYPDGQGAYRDCEAAFDIHYAEAMGLPIDKIDLGDEEEPIITVEEFDRDLNSFLDSRLKQKSSGLYILDSMDSLSDEEEMKADIAKGTYGMAKPKMLSKMFRKGVVEKLAQAQTCLFIVSQVRENIGVSFGEKYKRSGGKALDFYASQIVWLAHTAILKKTIKGVERPYGIKIKAKCKKNKVGFPFRECEFEFHFGYGIDDIRASINWLKEVKRLSDVDLKDAHVKDFLKGLDDLSTKEYNKERRRISKAVKVAWNEIENTFIPKRRKYETD